MQGKEVYILTLKAFDYDGAYEPEFAIGGIFENEAKAIQAMSDMIEEAKIDGMLEDIDNKVYKNKKILFYDHQDNWNHYNEYEIDTLCIE